MHLFTIEPYWRVVLSTGRSLTKHQSVWDQMFGKWRELDWTLDLLATGDILKIKELHLIYPGFRRSVSLCITEPGTAFQFCRQAKSVDMSTGLLMDNVEAQVIGRVTDKENGLCEGYIWDRVNGLIGYEDVSIYEFPSWRSGLMPPGRLALDVLGVRLS